MGKFRFSASWAVATSVLAGVLIVAGGAAVADGWNPGVGANSDGTNGLGLNRNSIVNSRHNLTMRYTSNRNVMAAFRNNYYEVCVYCHTPHGANSTAAAPLWNRTVTQRSYSLYNNPASLTDLPKSQPGPNSLTCLSCHDGATAIDSIINMPSQLGGSFRAGYMDRVDGRSPQEQNVNMSFLNAWSADGNRLVDNGTLSPQGTATADILPDGLVGTGHSAFVASGDGAGPCITCHQPGGSFGGVTNIPDFYTFVIGYQYYQRADGDPNRPGIQYVDDNSDGFWDASAAPQNGPAALFDDHPIGVRYPSTFGPDSGYREPDVIKDRIAFFDRDGDGHADPEDIRLYDTGDGYEVECASCHDPHGVPVGDTQDSFIPSFLRVGLSTTTDTSLPKYDARDEEIRTAMAGTNISISGNAGSKLCLTCHVK